MLVVTVSLLLELPSILPDRLVFHWRRAPWSHICGAFRRVDWTFPTDVDSTASYLTNQILTITKRFVPHCKPRLVRPVPWWNGDCQWVWVAKLSAWRCGDSGRYRFLCCSARGIYHSAFHCYQQRIRRTLFTRGSKFRVWWRLTRDIAGFSTYRQRVVPPADDLADYFTQKFVIPGEASSFVPLLSTDCVSAALSSFRLTCKRVKCVLLGLDESKSVGLDGVSPRVLCRCAGVLSYPLFKLFKKILSSHSLGRSLE